MSNRKWSKKAIELMLKELWQNAAFLSDTFGEFEGYIKSNNNNLKYDSIFNNLASVRNRYLIDQREQVKLENTVGAFFGLSVGSHAAITWATQSRARHIKIADPDSISTTNLNRIKVGYKQIGKLKAGVIKQELMKISPNIQVDVLYDKKDEKMMNFCMSTKTDFIVDAVDDLKSKLVLRKIAKSLRLPLIMPTDVGNNVFIDIERYDINPNQEYFLGRVTNIENIDFDKLSLKEKLNLIYKLIGFEDHSSKMLWSLANIGKEVLTWPQLASAATISGGLVTTALTKIITGESLDAGRYIFSVDRIFAKEQISEKEEKLRKRIIKKINSSLLC